MKWLCLGDIVSGPGRSAARDYLTEEIVRKHDLIVANGENTAGGVGLTVETSQQLMGYGIDVITGGNHIWKKKDFVSYLEENPRKLPVLRPANYPPDAPGLGYRVFSVRNKDVLVLNLQGRTFMEQIDCPFRRADTILERVDFDLALVDFHAEATSEKVAMGKYLAGRTTAVVGTHTHVQTADARVLDGGTAFITDLGMTGPYDSIIGVRDELAIKRFLTGRPIRFKVEKQGPRIVNGLSITVDEDELQAVEVDPIFEELPQRSH